MLGYYAIMKYYVVEPNSCYSYTDEKNSEITKFREYNFNDKDFIPPIEDIDISLSSEMLYN